MTVETKNIIYKIWLISLYFLPLAGCEYDSPQTIDYTGQIDSIVDIDGNKYTTIGIGTQIWMQKNLKTTRLSDGTILSLIADNIDWRNKNINTPAYCWYDNDSVENKSIYGGLYNFYSIETGLLCPTGWHVPSQAEWKTLVDYLGGKEIAGGKLKDYNGNYLVLPDRYIENNFKFHGLPGGFRHPETGEFRNKGFTGCWWANRISKEDDSKALNIFIGKEKIEITEDYGNKHGGASIRCVKDLIITKR